MDEPAATVARALAEDVGSGDLTAGLVPDTVQAEASVVTREALVLCGRDWFDEVFRQLDPRVAVAWHHADGARLAAGDELCRVTGPARALLTGERTALNFLQTLSGTATTAARWAAAVAGRPTVVLDTRKTLPGLRHAQKYAVRCGGCHNHRHGLWDGVLIKENHIAAAGGIAAAVAAARGLAGGRPVEVEVESLDGLDEAIAAGADVALLDNFSDAQVADAVRHAAGRIVLEASGNVTLERLPALAATGVDRVSAGALTKDLAAVDLSLRFRYKR